MSGFSRMRLLFVSGFLLRAEREGVVLRRRDCRVRRVVRVGRPRGRRKGGIEGGILRIGFNAMRGI